MKEQNQLDIDTEEGTIKENKTIVPNSSSGIMAAISELLASGQIDKHTARQIKMMNGFSLNDHTKKRITRAKRKARRKMQKESRRRNRGSVRGQKCTKGQRYSVAT